MSRIGKQPVTIPSGIELKIGSDGATVTVKGPIGSLSRTLPMVKVELEGGVATVTPTGQTREHRSCHGLSRALLNNMVVGCSVGHKRGLEINGTGYKAELQGQKLKLTLGFSHDVLYELPKTVKGEVDKRGMKIDLVCPDKELLGMVAAKIRSFRPPEPYKGKGVKYSDEIIRRKAGKAGK